MEHQAQISVNFFRFLFMLVYFILPLILLGIFIFIRGIHKNSKVVFIFYSLRQFQPYKYVLHNVIFSFLSLIMFFDVVMLLYSFFDEYISKSNSIANLLMDKGDRVENQTVFSIFWSTMVPGLIFHLIFYFVYSYYNLYNTNSYFGESWRRWILSQKHTNPRLKKLKETKPEVYKKIYKWFLDIDQVDVTDDMEIKTFL